MKSQGEIMKFKRIGWMMIVSQLTLLLFTCVWISHQYQISRDRMQQDFQTIFNKTQTRLTDNILDKLIDSILVTQLGADSTATPSNTQSNGIINIDSLMNHSPGSVKKIVVTDQTSVVHISEVHGDSLMSARQAMKVLSPSEGFQIKKILRSTLKQVLVNKELNHEVSVSKVDSNALIHAFSDAIKDNYPLVKLVWADAGGNPKFRFKPKDTVHFYILAQNYQRYNFISILPQIGFVIFLLGITGLSFWLAYKNMKRQTAFAEQKNTFISNISHELKTPVATTKVALEALSTYHGIDDPDRTKRYLKIAEWEMNRLAALINRVLNTVQTENGLISLELEVIDVVALLKEVVTTLSPSINEKNIAVEYDDLPNELYVNVDALHLNGVLYNLIDNAIKYGDGVIKIKAGEEGDHVFISVANTGSIISNEYRSKIFEKFFRIPDGSNHSVKGHGLGLSYALYVAKAHGGNLVLENNTANTNFIVTLPKTK
jgi:signal transduction histidine kinase